MWTCQINQTKIGDNTNVFTLSESAINAIKKPELVQKIIALKGKIIMYSDISSFCNEMSKLNDTTSQMHSANEQIRSELAVVKNVNTKLEGRIITLKKVKQSPRSTAVVITLNQLVFRMIYQKIIWRN